MDDKLQVLVGVPLLASLGEELMKGMAERATFVAFKKGELVVHENDPGDALYVIVTGRLQAYTRLGSGRERVFATYCNGDCFGEMPLLSGETQSASIRALSDSVLLKIPRQDFDDIVNRDPRVAVGFTRRMGQRIKQLQSENHAAKTSHIIAIYSAVPGAGKTLLATNLVASLAAETAEPVLLLDFSGRQRSEPLGRCERLFSGNGYDSSLVGLIVRTPQGYDRASFELRGDESEPRLIAPLFGAVVKYYDYVLVELPNETSATAMECLLQADQIYVLTKNEDEQLSRTRVLLQDLRERASLEPKAKIILTAVGQTRISEAEQKLGVPVSYFLRWIPEESVVESVSGVPFVLRQPMDAYSLVVRRMARELGNVMVGLALGTGAARGLGHIGVIRVLEREGIAVDMVAGSSMGSLIAAAWAIGKTADEMQEIALRVKGRRAFLKLLDPMFPGSGFIRGIKVGEFLHDIVDDLTFADTLIPLRISASDFNTMEEVVFEHGRLLDAIRASISIPGVFRPVALNGRTLIDGGITDPVPVDVLARAGVGKIIAVNTIPNIEEMKQRVTSRSDGKMHETGPVVETPTSIINVYMRSMQAMQSRLAEDACARADIILRPGGVPGAVWYDFYHPEKYIRAGELAAEAALPKLKELVRA
jgi:NTE family protein